jgi:hypothetical protein
MGIVGLLLRGGEETLQGAAERRGVARLRLGRREPVLPPIDEPGSVADTARRFEVWARAMLDIEKNRAIALDRGLDAQRLDLMNRFAIDLDRRLRELR